MRSRVRTRIRSNRAMPPALAVALAPSLTPLAASNSTNSMAAAAPPHSPRPSPPSSSPPSRTYARLTFLERAVGGALTCVWQYLFWCQPGVDRAQWMAYDLEWWPGVPEVGLLRRVAIVLWGTPALVCGCYALLYRFEFGWAERYRVEGSERVGWNDPDAARRSAYAALNGLAFRRLLAVQSSLLLPLAALAVWSYRTGYITPAVYAALAAPPPLSTVVWQLAAGLVFFETAFYWGHRVQHRWFYRWHKEHHEYTHPNVLTAGWGTDVDRYVTAHLPGLIPVVYFRMHVWTLHMWNLLHYTHTYVDHGGYEFPFNPFQLIPFSNHVRAHDFHHSRNTCNYGLYWRVWDWLMSTDADWRAHERREGIGAPSAVSTPFACAPLLRFAQN